jgi:2-C-methyl-D-erythritol 4-phosphate cytidylyltransferase/2-C-methyl-D-erythritol 2,4-cyclodiphosphate synthase
MSTAPPLPAFAAVVVAAGKGLRAGQPLPKQFAMWRGKPVLRHSVEALLASGADPLVVAIPENGEAAAKQALEGLTGYELVTGGATRQQSVARALSAIGSADRVLIHDAARPDLPETVIARLLDALDNAPGAIPVLPVVDSLSRDENGLMVGTARREELRRVQTPQAFRFADIRSAHAAWEGDPVAGDDAQVLRAAGGAVAHIAGDERLAKLTFAEDFMTALPPMRVGMGYDVHRLAEGEELWLGGIRIEHELGLAGHSDADVALHAIVDALLGAIADGDIGSHFPPSDLQWKGASSDRFLAHAARLVTDAGYAVGNIDLTIICEAPKIGPHRQAMRERIADLLGVDINAISVKATTSERLGFTGRGEGIAAQAIASVIRE